MYSKHVTVQLPEGLHMKAAGDFSQLAGKFKSAVYVEHNGRSVDAKSLLGILSLAAKNGAEIAVAADGPDEEEAVEALTHMAIVEG